MNLELVLISKEKNIKTFKICDNWDNPSSRSFIEPKEDFIGVWGKQGLEHARDINFFKTKNIFILGSASSRIIQSIKIKINRCLILNIYYC